MTLLIMTPCFWLITSLFSCCCLSTNFFIRHLTLAEALLCASLFVEAPAYRCRAGYFANAVGRLGFLVACAALHRE